MRPEVARSVYRVLRFVFGEGRSYRLRMCRRYVRRAGRWLWRKAEAATWERVKLRLIQCVTVALLVILVDVLWGISCARVEAGATDRARQYHIAFQRQIERRIELFDRRVATSEARLLAVDSALNDGARAAEALGLPAFHAIPVGQLAALVQDARRQERIERASRVRVGYDWQEREAKGG